MAVLVPSLTRRQSGGDPAQRVPALERTVRRLEDEPDRSPRERGHLDRHPGVVRQLAT
jgi:hypothetical protein